MGVRIPIEVRRASSSHSAVTSALLNTGFESEQPELLVPAGLAKELSLLPDLPPGTTTEEYQGIGGAVLLHRVEKAVSVRVQTEEGREATVACSVLVSAVEREAILNDAAVSALRIEVSDPRGGKWRFAGEATQRQGVGKHLW